MRSLIVPVAIALTIPVKAVTVQITIQEYPRCVHATGVLNAIANGGVGPYTYLWNTGATDSYLSDLPAGTYSVTVTDGLGEQATDELVLISQPLYEAYGFWMPGCPEDDLMQGPAKRLFCSGGILTTGVGPHSVSGSSPGGLLEDPNYGEVFYFGNFTGSTGQPLNYTITDAFGCSTSFQTTIPPDPEWLQPQVLTVDGACSGGNNGSMQVHVPAEENGWASGFMLFKDGVDWSGAWQCCPNFGQSPVNLHITGLPAGTYQLVSTIGWDNTGWDWLLDFWFAGIEDACRDTTEVIVPELGYTCGTVSGRAFVDANENCIQNGGEPGLPTTIIEVQPGGYYGLTNGSGQYSMNLPYGSYTVSTVDPQFEDHCTASTTPFTLSSGQATVTKHLPDTSLVGLDVDVDAASGAARPGFALQYGLHVENLTGVLSGTGTLTMTFDPNLTFLSANPTPSNVTGNTITWNLTTLNAFQHRHVYPRFQVPPNINLLGTVLTSTVTVGVTNPEADLGNNTYVHEVTVTGAYDPNDKTAQTSSHLSTEVYQIDQDEWIDYTIRFQNTGTDTAFFVVITDTLPETLDPTTFEVGAASHAHGVAMLGQGVLRWTFPNILLPDSNVNEPASHGFVSFRIRPRLPLLPGTVFENTANIYFDYNPPVITEPSVLVAEFSTTVQEHQIGQLRLLPNPVNEVLTMTVPEGTALVFELLTIDGRLLAVPTVRRSDGFQLDVRSLASGIYVVRTTAGTVRFVKQ